MKAQVVGKMSFRGDRPFSPSEVEAYINCPYCWYLKYILGINEEHKDLDSLAWGSIIHETLSETYTFLHGEGQKRISQDMLPKTIDISSEIFYNKVDKWLIEKLNRLEPLTGVEKAQADSNFGYIKNTLTADVEFLPMFQPTMFEHKIGESNQENYAGEVFTGKIDRVDICGNRAVIIDYKSGKKQKAISSEREDVQKKVQTAIYARILERERGLRVVGSLYRSVKDGSIGGAIDGDVLIPDDLAISEKNFVSLSKYEKDDEIMTFAEYLDMVEEEVKKACEGMKRGIIPNMPHKKDSKNSVEKICMRKHDLDGLL